MPQVNSVVPARADFASDGMGVLPFSLTTINVGFGQAVTQISATTLTKGKS